jgi:hypothetical protein
VARRNARKELDYARSDPIASVEKRGHALAFI